MGEKVGLLIVFLKSCVFLWKHYKNSFKTETVCKKQKIYEK